MYRLVFDATSSDGTPAAGQVLFTKPNEILVIYQIGGDQNAVVWNLKTGQATQQFQVSGKNAAVSLDGRFLVSNDAFSMPIYAIKSGEIVASLASPQTEQKSLISYSSFAFSADTSMIAAFNWFGQKSFTCWNSQGGVIFNFLAPEPWSRFVTINTPVQWLPDGSGWLIGDVLLHRELAQPVWRIDQKFGSRADPRLINQNWVLVPHERLTGQAESSWSPVRIPWDRINGILEACPNGDGVRLEPGEPLKVKARVQVVDDNVPDNFTTGLASYLNSHYEKLGQPVSDDAATIVRMTYIEIPSEEFDGRNRETSRDIHIKFEYVRGEVVVPTFMYDDGPGGTLSVHQRTAEQIARRRTEELRECFEKIQLPRAVASDTNLVSLPIRYTGIEVSKD